MEFDFRPNYVRNGEITFVLDRDHTTFAMASTIARIINEAEAGDGRAIARANGPGEVVVKVPTAELGNVTFRDPEFPVVSNVTAEPVDDADTARQTLVSQLTAPVRWTQSMTRIAGEGIVEFVEIGPGKVLTGLLRRIDRNLAGLEIGKPDDVEKFSNRGLK